MTNRTLPCPICHKPLPDSAPADSPLFPFCSVRCREIDLLRWCNGEYAIAEPLDAERMQEALGDPEQEPGDR